MAQQITLITGCSSGIGLTLAVKMAQDPDKRYLVYATMRDLGKKDALEEMAGSALNDTLFIKELDVTRDEQVKSVCKAIIDKHFRIDVLVNNAAVGFNGLLESMSMDLVKSIFDTNFFGVVRMTQEVIPGMKQRRSGRIINISSLLGHYAIPFNDIYLCTKFAMEGLTESQYAQLKFYNVHVSSIQSGAVATKFFDKMFMGLSPADMDNAIENADEEDTKIMMSYIKTLKEDFGNDMERSEDVVAVIMGSLQAEHPKLRYPTSDRVRDVLQARYADGTGCSFAEELGQSISSVASKVSTE